MESFRSNPSFESFCKQERALIVLNLMVLGCLFVIHVWHFSVDGGPERALLIAFGLRFLWQVGDLLWLQTRDVPPSPRTVDAMARMSLALHLWFGWFVTLFGDEERTHFIVLMALPVAAAGFRFGWVGTLLVWLVAAAHSFFEVWFYHLTRPPLPSVELFESATISLLYLVVGVVTLLLAQQLLEREALLQASMRELEATREAMINQERHAAIGRLSRAVAHEVRNPVTMIASSLAVWREKKGNSENAVELLTMIEGEAQRLEKLTTDFLSFARERKLEFREADARDALELAASTAGALAEKQGVTLRLSESVPERMQGVFDPFAVQQVLLNLIRNGIEASRSGGSVTFGAVAGSMGDLIFWVENDAGPIEDAVAQRLFQPFETTKRQGSGLGLATSLAIAKAHGGDLRLAVNEVGRVRFELVLPRNSIIEEERV